MNPGLPRGPSQSDRRELKEVIKEFLSRYQYLHEKRVHKLLFYSEIYTLQHYGERISAADFKPYDYGPYAELIRDVLHEMEQDNEITIDYDGTQAVFKTNTTGNLSQEKTDLIDDIHTETCSMRTTELVQFAKSTPLWRNHDYDEEMNFEEYLSGAILEEDTREDLTQAEREPADSTQVEALLG